MRHLLVAMALTLVCCGGKDDETKSLTLLLDDPAVSVLPGASVTTMVHLVRGGPAVGANATLTATNAPTGVTVAFDSDTTTSDAMTVTVSAAAGTAFSTASVTISAAASGVTASTPLAITVGTPATITVRGEIVNADFRQVPATEIAVWSAGAAEPVQLSTNTDGTFTIFGVTPPYDIAVTNGPNATVVLGLTRVDPIIASLSDDERIAPSDGTSISVALGDASPPAADATRYALVACGTMLATASRTTDNPIVMPFDGTIPDSQNCTLDALELSPKANGFTDKFGFGHSTVGVNLGVAAEGTAQITSYTGTGTSIDMQVSAFDDGAIYAVSQYWVASPRVAFSIGESSAAESDLAVPPPSAALTFTVQAIILRPNGETIVTQLLTNAATQTLVLPAPVTMTSPSDGTTGADESTTFTVSGGNAATNVFSFGTADGTRIDFVTTASSLSLADLSRHGLTLAKGTAYTMNVDAYDNVPTVDAWAVGAGTGPWLSGGNVTDRSSGVTFTTQSD